MKALNNMGKEIKEEHTYLALDYIEELGRFADGMGVSADI